RRIFMKSAPTSGASEKPASVNRGMRARRALSCSDHSTAFNSASMIVSSRPRADQPQELRLQILFFHAQPREIGSCRDQPPCDLLRMTYGLSAGKVKPASRPTLPIRFLNAGIDHEASRGQRRTGALAVTRVHYQPATAAALHLVRAQLLQQPPLVDHADAR